MDRLRNGPLLGAHLGRTRESGAKTKPAALAVTARSGGKYRERRTATSQRRKKARRRPRTPRRPRPPSTGKY
eukprot:4448123-Pyramimonas_sp.AAC.1